MDQTKDQLMDQSSCQTKNKPTLDLKLGVIESRFADLIWDHEPISSQDLVRLCEAQLNWKKSTTYTVLKKLSERGLFQNLKGTVSSRISRSEFQSIQTERIVKESFQGSLPQFIAAFTRTQALSEAEIAEIRRLIESSGEE